MVAFASEESWFVIEQEGKTIGFGYETFHETDEAYHYRSDLTMQMSVMELEEVSIQQAMEFVTDKNHYAKSLEHVINMGGTVTHSKTVFDDEITITTITGDGREHVKTIDHNEPIYFSSSFLHHIFESKEIEIGRKYTALAWDAIDEKPEDLTLHIKDFTTYEYEGEDIPVYLVEFIWTYSEEMLVSADMIAYWGYEPMLGITYRKVEQENIPELDYMAADILIVPGNVHITHPYRSTESTIKVFWNNAELDDFNFEDNRQILKAHSKTEEKHEATIKVIKDERNFEGKITLPIEDDAFSQYLSDTQYITASSPKIKQIIEEILDENEDGWSAVQKINEWVFNYIQPALIPETLTTEEILEKRTGKCVEYSVLFASLARAAGLPTRLAFGERYEGTIWIGHMWNEVWLGEWIAIDASHNQVTPDALLLKFTDSHDIEGTQGLRRRLIGNLDILIEDVTIPQTTSTDLTTGIENNTYTSAEFNCRISAPQTWNIVETIEGGMPMVVMMPKDDLGASVVFMHLSLPPGITAAQVIDMQIPELEKELPEFNLTGVDMKSLGKYEASVATYTFEQFWKFRQEMWVTVQDDNAYIMIFANTVDGWENYTDTFENIRESFQIIK